MKTTDWIEIFRIGKYPQGNWDKKKLDRVVSNYDVKFHEAPAAVTHADDGTPDGGPAYGWVVGIKRQGDLLLGKFRDIADGFVKMVTSGAYKQRSAEFYKDLEGKGPYLRRVAFLGADIPAVKGLSPVSFEDEKAEFLTFTESMKTPPVEEKDMSKELQQRIDEMEKKQTDLEKQLEEKDSEVDKFKEEAKNAEAEKKKILVIQRHDDISRFCEEMTAGAKLSPAIAKSGMVEFMESLSDQVADENPLVEKFSEKDKENKVSQLGFFKAFVKQLPVVEVFKEEIATKKKAKEAKEPTKSFDSEGGHVNDAAMELHQKVQKYAEEHNVSYEEALNKVK